MGGVVGAHSCKASASPGELSPIPLFVCYVSTLRWRNGGSQRAKDLPDPQGHLEWALGSAQVSLVALRIPIHARLTTVVTAVGACPRVSGDTVGLDRLR